MEPKTLEVQPLRGADQSAVGVCELVQSVALGIREGVIIYTAA